MYFLNNNCKFNNFYLTYILEIVYSNYIFIMILILKILGIEKDTYSLCI